jgi:hypothetical protein
VEEDVFMVDDDDGNEREMLEVEEGEVVVEELVVEVGERIEELLLEIEITVCRVVAEEVEMDGKALLEVLLFMN